MSTPLGDREILIMVRLECGQMEAALHHMEAAYEAIRYSGVPNETFNGLITAKSGVQSRINRLKATEREMDGGKP